MKFVLCFRCNSKKARARQKQNKAASDERGFTSGFLSCSGLVGTSTNLGLPFLVRLKQVWIVVICCSLVDEGGAEEYSTFMQKHWTCSRCAQTLIVTVAERLAHEQTCHLSGQQKEGKTKRSRELVSSINCCCDVR